jgi:hypothetical protein
MRCRAVGDSISRPRAPVKRQSGSPPPFQPISRDLGDATLDEPARTSRPPAAIAASPQLSSPRPHPTRYGMEPITSPRAKSRVLHRPVRLRASTNILSRTHSRATIVATLVHRPHSSLAPIARLESTVYPYRSGRHHSASHPAGEERNMKTRGKLRYVWTVGWSQLDQMEDLRHSATWLAGCFVTLLSWWESNCLGCQAGTMGRHGA